MTDDSTLSRLFSVLVKDQRGFGSEKKSAVGNHPGRIRRFPAHPTSGHGLIGKSESVHIFTPRPGLRRPDKPWDFIRIDQPSMDTIFYEVRRHKPNAASCPCLCVRSGSFFGDPALSSAPGQAMQAPEWKQSRRQDTWRISYSLPVSISSLRKKRRIFSAAASGDVNRPFS